MKRIIAVIVGLIMVLAAVGCGGIENKIIKSEEKPVAETADVADSTYEIDDALARVLAEALVDMDAPNEKIVEIRVEGDGDPQDVYVDMELGNKFVTCRAEMFDKYASDEKNYILMYIKDSDGKYYWVMEGKEHTVDLYDINTGKLK